MKFKVIRAEAETKLEYENIYANVTFVFDDI